MKTLADRLLDLMRLGRPAWPDDLKRRVAAMRAHRGELDHTLFVAADWLEGSGVPSGAGQVEQEREFRGRVIERGSPRGADMETSGPACVESSKPGNN